MKVGSIVECVHSQITNMALEAGCTPAKRNGIYTVRASDTSLDLLYLEEIKNPVANLPGYLPLEWGFKHENFRELLPPMEIQSALASCEPVLIELSPVINK